MFKHFVRDGEVNTAQVFLRRMHELTRNIDQTKNYFLKKKKKW